MSSASSVVIVGGGLSGIAAAMRLAQQGLRVTLVETRMRLGGRATSFTDPTTGQLLDNCQHVLLRCCTNLLDLYERLGVADQIQWHSRFYFCNAQGHIDLLEADDLPAPFQMTASLMRFKSLSCLEKIAISQGMLALMRMGVQGRQVWHSRSFGDWLRTHRQPAGAIQKFWAPVAIGSLNEQLDNMAADYAIQVFQEGFCANEKAAYMGLPTGSLVELYDAAEKAITQVGGKVLLRTSATQFCFEKGQVVGLEIQDQPMLKADAFISAVPFDRLQKLSTPAMAQADERLTHLDQFKVTPILGIHIWFDRQVMDLPHLSLTESPLHWIFNKGMSDDGKTQHLHGVISAANDWVDQPAEAILTMVEQEIRKVLPFFRKELAASKLAPGDASEGTGQNRNPEVLLPRAIPGELPGRAGVVHGRVVKEKRATFSIEPGIDACRPLAVGSIENFFLAGDWTDSGWPATMEGAVRSGYQAAAAILGEPTGLIPPLPDSNLYQLISG